MYMKYTGNCSANKNKILSSIFCIPETCVGIESKFKIYSTSNLWVQFSLGWSWKMCKVQLGPLRLNRGLQKVMISFCTDKCGFIRETSIACGFHCSKFHSKCKWKIEPQMPIGVPSVLILFNTAKLPTSHSKGTIYT